MAGLPAKLGRARITPLACPLDKPRRIHLAPPARLLAPACGPGADPSPPIGSFLEGCVSGWLHPGKALVIALKNMPVFKVLEIFLLYFIGFQ